MAPPRAFDYDLLKELVLANPDWSSHRYALKLTAANRRKDPGAPAVLVSTVDSVLSRYRQIWEAEEDTQIPRRVQYRAIAPPPGALSGRHKMDTPMVYLREADREAHGDNPDTEASIRLRRSALKWADGMRRDKMVVDLTATGVPVVRLARDEEIDSRGQVISLAAWMIPGWRSVRV